LSLLHLLRLLRMGLLHLAGLLLVLLLELLRSHWIGLLFRELLMLVVLLPLQVLPVLVLLRDHLVLLLLVFLIQLRVTGVGSGGPFDGRQFLGMRCRRRASSRSDRRRAVIRSKPLLRVITGRPRMLSLSGYGRGMSATSRRLFLSRGARGDPAATAVETDAIHPLVHPGVVNVVDDIGVHPI